MKPDHALALIAATYTAAIITAATLITRTLRKARP